MTIETELKRFKHMFKCTQNLGIRIHFVAISFRFAKYIATYM